MVLTMEMGEDWDLGPTIPFYFARKNATAAINSLLNL